jgi:hypothetical protein
MIYVDYRDLFTNENNVTTSELQFVASSMDNGSVLMCKARNPRFDDFEMTAKWTLEVFCKCLTGVNRN